MTNFMKKRLLRVPPKINRLIINLECYKIVFFKNLFFAKKKKNTCVTPSDVRLFETFLSHMFIYKIVILISSINHAGCL